METTSNKQKAREIASLITSVYGVDIKREIDTFTAAMQAMDWKDGQHAKEKQRWIDKAAEWFEKYLFDIGYPDDWLRDSPNTTNGKTRFIQAMKGE